LILQQSWGIAWFSESEKVLAYLPDVGGLKPGNPIWLAGIEIGKVRQVSIMSPELYPGNARVFKQISEIKKEIEGLDRNNPNYGKLLADKIDKIRDLKLELRLVEVQMDIKKQYINRISIDSEVAIASRGLIGDSFLEVSPGTAGIPPKRQGEFYVIEAVPGDTRGRNLQYGRDAGRHANSASRSLDDILGNHAFGKRVA